MLVMSDPWGARQSAAVSQGVLLPLPPRLARLANVQATGIALVEEDPYAEGFPAADELPEVQTLMHEGWRPLHPAPLYCLLPAAWPSELRTWVPNRLPRVAMGGSSGSYFGGVTPFEDDDDWEAEETAEQARVVGLPAPPTGRIWLLRSPWPRIPVAVIYQIIWAQVERHSGPDEIQQVYQVGRDVLTWDEARALAACPPEIRELIDAWALAGRVGEAAATPIEHRLHPRVVQEATDRTGLDENTLLAWLDSLQTDLDEDTITFIKSWRSADLPGNPPPGACRFTDRDPAELRTWLVAGFGLYAATQLGLAGLDTAIRWRNAGFTEAETYELLRSDPTLTTDEAHAFDPAGPARERRREWIYYGFTAADAANWTAAGLTPTQARLWRACGLQPADVGDGQRIPPQLINGQTHIGFTTLHDGEITYPEWDDLADPPGTRGRRARRRARDNDPWMNTD